MNKDVNKQPFCHHSSYGIITSTKVPGIYRHQATRLFCRCLFWEQGCILSTAQLPHYNNVLMMFSPKRTPLKDILLPLLNHKCLKAYPNHHLRNKYANIFFAEFLLTLIAIFKTYPPTAHHHAKSLMSTWGFLKFKGAIMVFL